jgi:hypothetical protein
MAATSQRFGCVVINHLALTNRVLQILKEVSAAEQTVSILSSLTLCLLFSSGVELFAFSTSGWA